MKINYNVYRFSLKEWVLCLGQCVALWGMIDYVFYKSWWLMIGIVPIGFFFIKWKKKEYKKERRKRLNFQFKDALAAFGVALQAGYSVENALGAATRDLEKLYGTEDEILQEFHYMEAQIRISVPIEDLLLDFGNRCKVEDISNFATVFATTKRSGGDMIGVLRKTVSTLSDKIEVKKEIEATVAAKKGEQMIMSMMPFAIILYMQVTSPGFLQVLYGNALGVTVMSACLGIYFLAYWMGKRIVDIEV